MRNLWFRDSQSVHIVHWHSSCIRSTLIWFTRKNGTLRELAPESKETREGETTSETLQEKRKREEKRREEDREEEGGKEN